MPRRTSPAAMACRRIGFARVSDPRRWSGIGSPLRGLPRWTRMPIGRAATVPSGDSRNASRLWHQAPRRTTTTTPPDRPYPTFAWCSRPGLPARSDASSARTSTKELIPLPCGGCTAPPSSRPVLHPCACSHPPRLGQRVKGRAARPLHRPAHHHRSASGAPPQAGPTESTTTAETPYVRIMRRSGSTWSRSAPAQRR